MAWTSGHTAENWSRCSSGGEEVVDWLERDAVRAWAKPPRRLVVACL